jgi:hypothetical protein
MNRRINPTSVTEWKAFMRAFPETSKIAGQILKDLSGYRETSLDRATDQDSLGNALTAFAQLVRSKAEWE